MNILVLNAGSGSQKCSLFQIGNQLPEMPLEPFWEAQIAATAPGLKADELLLTIQKEGQKEERRLSHSGTAPKQRLKQLLTLLWEGNIAAVNSPQDIHIIGHRVVHGGTEFTDAVIIDDYVEAAIERLAEFAPLHNPRNLDGIRMARELFGSNTPQVAVFDTSFHRSLPAAAAVYPGPHDWLKRGIRRYGFHGTSFRWASEWAAHLLKRKSDSELRLIICHLGGGCSLAATVGGKSVDTTMGFTPLDGIAMCTRPGALDPGILLFLMKQDPDLGKLERILNEECGLKGLSGLPGDTRIILANAFKGDPNAELAMDVFIHRLQAGIGQMLAALGAIPNAIVFTDAIGEDEPIVRAQACEPFRFLGLQIDMIKNQESQVDADISTNDSKVRVLIVKSREDWQMAKDCYRLGKT